MNEKDFSNLLFKPIYKLTHHQCLNHHLEDIHSLVVKVIGVQGISNSMDILSKFQEFETSVSFPQQLVPIQYPTLIK